MIAAIELERRMVNTCILSIFICKFSHEYELCLMILLLVNKSIKLNFYYVVWSVSLNVYLRMESSGELSSNAEKVA